MTLELFHPLIYPYLPTPALEQDMIQGHFFKRSLTGLNSEFSFSKTSYLTKAEEPSLSYLPIAGGRIILFPRVLVLCEMQLAWSRIWTRIAVSISYDDNHYTSTIRWFIKRYKLRTFKSQDINKKWVKMGWYEKCRLDKGEGKNYKIKTHTCVYI